jgi:hypothetical protein
LRVKDESFIVPEGEDMVEEAQEAPEEYPTEVPTEEGPSKEVTAHTEIQ